MNSPSIFVALVEVKPNEGAFLDPEEIGGAVVRAYIPARDREEALAVLAEELRAGYFTVVNIEWCVNQNEVEWENENDTTSEALSEEARQNGEITFGEFHCWDRE